MMKSRWLELQSRHPTILVIMTAPRTAKLQSDLPPMRSFQSNLRHLMLNPIPLAIMITLHFMMEAVSALQSSDQSCAALVLLERQCNRQEM